MQNNFVELMENSSDSPNISEIIPSDGIIPEKENLITIPFEDNSEEGQSSVIHSSYYFISDCKEFSMLSSDSMSVTSQKSFVTQTETKSKTNKKILPSFLSQKIKKKIKCDEKKGFAIFNNGEDIYNEVTKYSKESLNGIIALLNNNSIVSKQKDIIKKKIFKLKFLPTKFINPVQECRFMDYMFPLNSEMFESDHKVVMKYYFQLEKIKRISSIERDLKTNSYKLFMEDANSQQISMYLDDKNSKLGYFKNWLMSLGNEKAIHFKEYLEIYEKKLQRNYVPFVSAENDSSYSDYYSLNSKNDIYWVKKLNANTVDWINKNPNNCKVYEINRFTGLMDLKYIEFDKRCLELMQVVPSLQDQRNGFLFTERIKLENYYGFFLERFTVDMKEIYSKGIEQPETCVKFRYYNNDGYCGDIVVAMFKEKYIQNQRFYSKTIGVQLNPKKQ